MAAEFKFPNEIDPLGSNVNRTLDFQRLSQGKQKQISVRVGEIIRGKIVEVISPTQAIISLPDGTFSAEITGKFKSGDELFFRVQSVEPSLVLKIYSIFVGKENKELPISEILRILNLPKTNLFETIISNEKNKANVIIREDVILKAKYANNFLEKFSKENIELLLRFIDFALESNIEPNIEFFEHYKRMFLLKEIIPKLISVLNLNLELFPDSTKSKIQELRKILQQNVPFSTFIKYFSPNFNHINENIFNLVAELKTQKLSTDMTSIVDDFLKCFNSLWIINSAASLSVGNTIFFIIPYIWENNVRFTLFRYRKRKLGNTDEHKFNPEDEELIQPIKENLEKEMGNYFTSSEGRNELNLLQSNFRRNSRKEGIRLIIKTPTGNTQLLRLINLPNDNQTGVSIVI
ncbi:MAG: hypothetical protein N2560_04765 [Ignavibacteria bacterium]|nr:hypothetical protein [Ignavibacteria bacterium]